MTLDDLERPLSTLFQNACVFGAHHENVIAIVSLRPSVCQPVCLSVRNVDVS